MIQYKSLENTSYEQLAECFRLAFSDYYFPMQLSPQQLQAHLEQSGVDLGLSYGAFADETIVGFIFNASSLYNGQKAAFDVGTAVVPQHRGKGVFHQMFQNYGAQAGPGTSGNLLFGSAAAKCRRCTVIPEAWVCRGKGVRRPAVRGGACPECPFPGGSV